MSTKAKKGSRAWKAKLSKSQKQVWEARKVRVRQEQTEFDASVAEVAPGVPENELRQRAKMYQHSLMYDGVPKTFCFDGGKDNLSNVPKEDKTFVGINRYSDPINHPLHYTAHPSGVECIQITEYMNFSLGNAIKYIWRAGLKSTSVLEDLRKARWYIDREIDRLEREAAK